MSQSALSGRRVCGKIVVTGERAMCPNCHRRLPGLFPAGSEASGILLYCKRCKQEFEIHTQRPAATAPCVR